MILGNEGAVVIHTIGKEVSFIKEGKE